MRHAHPRHTSAGSNSQLTPLLTHRVTTPTPPPSLPPSALSYLADLSDYAFAQIDAHGPIHYLSDASTSPPAYLRHLALRARALSNSFPLLPTPSAPSSSRRRSRARPHAAKRCQIAAVARLLSHIVRSQPHHNHHILDIGAGHGHLAAHLARCFDLPVTALDNNPRFLRTANALHSHANLSLSLTDVTATPPTITADSILLGLHACGALGDSLIRLATIHRPAASLLVSCCLQKLPPDTTHRPALSRTAAGNNSLAAFLTLPRAVLGATNRPHAAPTPRNLRSRVTRHALRTLLADRNHPLRHGDEVRGLSRHALKRRLVHLAPTVLAHHGIPGTVGETEAHARMAAAERGYALMRKFSVPRVLAGEVLEMVVVLDRAAALQETGYRRVLTSRVWPHAISPRNLCCAAW